MGKPKPEPKLRKSKSLISKEIAYNKMIHNDNITTGYAWHHVFSVYFGL